MTSGKAHLQHLKNKVTYLWTLKDIYIQGKGKKNLFYIRCILQLNTYSMTDANGSFKNVSLGCVDYDECSVCEDTVKNAIYLTIQQKMQSICLRTVFSRIQA
jgi:hypothetical protein